MTPSLNTSPLHTATINDVPVNIHNIFIPFISGCPTISHLTFSFFLTSMITALSWETLMTIALFGTLSQHVQLRKQEIHLLTESLITLKLTIASSYIALDLKHLLSMLHPLYLT